MAFNYSPKIITDGLVLYLDPANNRSYPTTGDTYFDLSKNNYDGQLVNSPTYNTDYYGTMVFDGLSEYVNFGTTGNEIVRTMTSMTINIVCYCTGYGNPSGAVSWSPLTCIDRYTLGNSYRKFAFYLLKNGAVEGVYVEFFNGSGGGTSASNIRTDILNNYLVLTTTIDSTSCRLYVNGIMVDEKAGIVVNSNPQTSDFTVGSRINTTYNGYFKGSLNQVLFYNRALTADEVLQNYKATKTRFGL